MTDRHTSNKERVEALHGRLMDGMASIATPEQWRNFLRATQKVTARSLRNRILIMLQDPDATVCKGYGQWQKAGRQVRKGEHGIEIFAPNTYRSKSEHKEGEPETVETIVKGFHVVKVFDIRQTDGPELPNLTPGIVTGAAPRDVWDAVAQRITEHHKYELLLAPLDRRGPEGYADPVNRQVVISDRFPPAHQLAVLLHEGAGHLELGHVNDMASYRAHRGIQEIEAESVAYLVGGAAGVDTGATSFSYIASYAQGNPDMLLGTAARVIEAATAYLDLLPQERVTAQSGPELGLVMS